MKAFNVNIINSEDAYTTNNTFYQNPLEYTISADASTASYLLGLGVLTNTHVLISNLNSTNLQGDLKHNTNALKELGYQISITPQETILKNEIFKIKNYRILDMDSSDTFLTWVVVACFIDGTTKITNIANQNIKECKRIDVIYNHLKKAGVNINRFNDDLEIIGKKDHNYKGIYVNCFD